MRNYKLIKAKFHSFTQWTKSCNQIYSERPIDFSEGFSYKIIIELSSMLLTEKKITNTNRHCNVATDGLNCITYSLDVNGVVSRSLIHSSTEMGLMMQRNK